MILGEDEHLGLARQATERGGAVEDAIPITLSSLGLVILIVVAIVVATPPISSCSPRRGGRR